MRWKLAVVLIVVLAITPLTGWGSSPSPVAPAHRDRILDFYKTVDINEIEMWLTNFGVFGRRSDLPGGPAGTFYPRGTDMTCMFAAGIWIGGEAPSGVRVTVAEYDSEYQPGTMLDGGGWSDPSLERFRMYKLTPDSGPGDPDYDEWPVEDGAPVNPDGTPMRAGDQTLWCVFNDADPAYHIANAGGSEPIGVEISQLIYAYDLPDPLDRVILHDYRIRHRGSDPLSNAYVALWMDGDIGTTTDDRAGCDSLLGAAYGYSPGDDGIYGPHAPATTMLVLDGAGPSEGTYAAVDYINGTDPDWYEASYNYMRGLDHQGEPVYDPTTGRPTRYWHAGDPATGQGWTDENSADKRNMISMGPLAIAPGDVESVRVAFVLGQAAGGIDAVPDMRKVAHTVRRLDGKSAFPALRRWAIAGFYPNPFDPYQDGLGRIFVVAPRDGRIRVLIRSQSGEVVRVFAPQQVERGISAVDWDGTDGGGSVVPPGTYTFVMQVLEPRMGTFARLEDSETMSVIASGPRSGALVIQVLGSSGGTITIGAGAGTWTGTGTGTRKGEGGPSRAMIYDVQGRCLRSLVAPEGRGALSWDRRDDRGVRVPPGVYFLRGRVNGRVTTSRVLVSP